QLEPTALQHLSDTPRVLLTSGILPAAAIAIVLNLILPRDLVGEASEKAANGVDRHDTTPDTTKP
ncbi:MAG: hypothetical protein EA338_13460, partial [Roseinatronobacter sp.]